MSQSRISAKLQHSEALKFDVDIAGRKLQLNSSESMGQAFTPMEMFLVALAGCTAMDVQWIIEKQRQKVDKFEIAISGLRRKDDPMYYESIDMTYSLAGPDIRKDAVERAIRLSQEKYCSVRAMVKDSVKINIHYTITSGASPEATYTYGTPG